MLHGDSCLEISTITSKQEMKLIYKDDVPFYEDKGQLNTLILSGKDLIQELKLLDKYGISSISLNRYFCGNRINNLDFLRDYPFIKSVSISDVDFNLDGLYYLKGLESLIVMGKDTLDYSCFPNLKILDTRQPGPYKFPDQIHTLYIWYMKLKGKDLSSIKFPTCLRNLYILWSDINNLVGIPRNLEKLEVSYSRKFTSLQGLSNSSTTLKELHIENCPKLVEYSSLKSCDKVSKLTLHKCKTIPSLDFIPYLTNLQHFTFLGTKVLDCDLSYIKDIQSVYFNNNKDYNLRLKDIK